MKVYCIGPDDSSFQKDSIHHDRIYMSRVSISTSLHGHHPRKRFTETLLTTPPSFIGKLLIQGGPSLAGCSQPFPSTIMQRQKDRRVHTRRNF